MREAHSVTTPFVTPEETAEVLGVRPQRARTLIATVRESLQKNGAHGRSEAGAFANSRPRSIKAHAKKSRLKTRSARKKITRAKARRSH